MEQEKDMYDLRLPDSVFSRLTAASARWNKDVSEVIRAAINKGLKLGVIQNKKQAVYDKHKLTLFMAKGARLSFRGVPGKCAALEPDFSGNVLLCLLWYLDDQEGKEKPTKPLKLDPICETKEGYKIKS